MKKHLLILSLLLFSFHYGLFSQELPPTGGGEIQESHRPNCLKAEQREAIQSMLQQNSTALKRQGVIKSDRRGDVAFGWPLRKAAGFSFNSYYSTNNYVDQDPGPGLLDYHCDARTYNGHKGTDIDTWPFPWYMVENDLVEVIAGEEGTIIGKTDGNDDDHCSCTGQWNAVFVEHADGSRAWYGHMKKGSLTAKTIGQSVSKGEYLGVVASSGCSTQPHLHFEVYDDSNNLIDPYTGTCNSLNTTSCWVTQKPNREPTLNALLTHDTIPDHGCPGVNEAPHIANTFVPGQTIYMAIYFHDQLTGDRTTLRVRRPDNTIWKSWDHTSSDTYTKSWWFWSWVLPPGGPYGTWTFEVDYYGTTHIHEFDFLAALSIDLGLAEKVTLSPNPTSGTIEIEGPRDMESTVIDTQGRHLIKRSHKQRLDLSAFPKGIYFVAIESGGQVIVKKVVKK